MKKKSTLSIFMRLLSLLGNLRYVMVFAILFGVLGFISSTYITVYGVRGILEILNQNIDLGKKFVAIILVLGFLRGVFRYIEQMANHFIAFKLLASIRDIVFTSLRRSAPAKLEKHNKGDLISLITSDIELLEVFYAHTISPVCIAVIMAFIMTYYIGYYHPVLGLLAFLIYLSIGFLLPSYIKKKGGSLADEYRKIQGKLGGFVLDSLRGLTQINQFNQAKARLNAINELTDDISDIELRFKQKGAEAMSLNNVFIICANILFLIVASLLYYYGAIDFKKVLITFVSLVSSYGPFIAVANLGFTLQNTIAAANRVIAIIDEEPPVKEVQDGKSANCNLVKCENLHFAYENEDVLKDLNIDLNRNRIIGIMGKSGSGKSTFLRLLMRFWETSKGNITFDGVDISQINTRSLRDIQAFVTQDTHLFNDSILNNIKIANLNASDAEVVEACKKANLHDFIMTLPNGYETKVGELGDKLSGGEKQRIAISRAFLHHPKMLLLDESTSNLDSLNEAIILNSIHKESQDKMVVLVSHRASTLKLADEVYEMKEGVLKS